MSADNTLVPTECRPWGWFKVLDGNNTSRYKLKHILVKPGQRLSLQSHEHRREYWTVIGGSGKAVKGNQLVTLNNGDSIVIEKQEKHRLINDGTNDLEIIELQVGDYLGEDDIVRYEDDYNRVQ